MNTSKKSIAFIGHSYHKKTRSFDFFASLLQPVFEIDFFYDETWAGCKPLDITGIEILQYDIIILWQQINYVLHPDIDRHPHVVLVPMFDCHAKNLAEFRRFISNRNFKFINFCYAQHEACIQYGLNSLSVQYFPDPDNFDSKRNYDDLTGFFWPRRREITWDTVENLLSKKQLSRLFFHAAPDRGFPPVTPPEKARKQYQISISEWFDTKEELFQLLARANIYFAPRLYEGIGLSFLEAMAMGMCVVAPDSPTMNEYITHGVNGLLYDHKNPAPLDFSKAEQLGGRARESVESGHERWLKSIDDILSFISSKSEDNTVAITNSYNQKTLCAISDPSTRRNLVSETDDPILLPKAIQYGGIRTQGGIKIHSEEHPLITIATVTRNAENELPVTLASIFSQTYDNIELIIVDGDSADGTLQIIKDNEHYFDLWISEPDRGPYDAMNKAAYLARGKWILYLNAGDWFTDKAILEKVFTKSPCEADIIYGHHYYRHLNGNMFWHKANAFEWTHEMLRKGKLTNNWVKGIPGHQATLTKTSLLKKYRYDFKKFSYAADHDFLFKLSEAGCCFHHTDLTIAVYNSGGFSWQNAEDCMNEQWNIAQKYGPRGHVNRFYRKRIRNLKEELNLSNLNSSKEPESQGVCLDEGWIGRLKTRLIFIYLFLKTYITVWKSGLFSSKYYRNQYDRTLWHFIRKGATERKKPNPLFDTGYYLDRNPDVAACGINPLYHYILCGAEEGREPSPYISMAEYLEQNPELDPYEINPLRHYMKNHMKK